MPHSKPGAGGATGTTGIGDACTLNSDCAAPLVCNGKTCQVECAEARDCPANQRCVLMAGSGVCLPAESAHCRFDSDCIAPLVCAVDGQCRNECVTERDCPTGEFCVQQMCATASEANNGCKPLPAALDYDCMPRPRAPTDCAPFDATGATDIGYPRGCGVTLTRSNPVLITGQCAQECFCQSFLTQDGGPQAGIWLCPG